MEIEVKKKVIIILVIICVLLCVIFCGIIFVKMNISKKIEVTDFQIAQEQYNFDLESVEESNHFYTIQGWANKIDTKNLSYDMKIVLHHKISNEYLAFRAEMVLRDDLEVTEKEKELNYRFSGFASKINKHFLDKNTEYEVYILYQNNQDNVLIPTGHIITTKN